MSIIHMEGWDGLPVEAPLTWGGGGGPRPRIALNYMDASTTAANRSQVVGTGGKFGGRHFNLGTNANEGVVLGPAFCLEEVIVGMWFKCGALPGFTGAGYVCQFVTNAYENFPGLFIDSDTTGHLRLVRYTTAVSTTTPVVLQAGVWSFLEFYVRIHDTLGAWTVRKNGITVHEATGLDTKQDATTIRSVGLYKPWAGNSLKYDDLYIMDPAGATPNTFLGPIRIDRISPTANGTTNNFTPNTGSNFQAVDEDEPDSDTTYIESSTAGHIDEYTMGDISVSDPEVPIAVGVNAVPQRYSHLGKDIKLRLRDASGVQQSAALEVNYAYKRGMMKQIFDKDSLGGAWSQTTVNGVEAGVELA